MRKPGYSPKERGKGNKKRKAFVLINAEGKNKTETNYLKKFANRNVRIHFASGQSTDPVNMVNELVGLMNETDFDSKLGDRAFCLIDADVIPSKNIKIKEADIRAKNKNIELIVSSPCFEDWFLCHFCFTTRQFNSNAELICELQKRIPDYSKNRSDIYDILLPMLDNAIQNAKLQENYLVENGVHRHTVDFSPCTEAYRVIEGISKIETQNQCANRLILP